MVIFTLILAAFIFIALFWGNNQGKTCVIMQDNEIIHKIALTDNLNQSFTVGGKYENIVEIKNGEVYFSSSTCHNHLCEQTGKISRVNETAVCLPNNVLVKIIGEDAEFDVVLN